MGKATEQHAYGLNPLPKSSDEHFRSGYVYQTGRVSIMERTATHRFDALRDRALVDITDAGVEPTAHGWADNPYVKAAAQVHEAQRPVIELRCKESCKSLRADLREEQYTSVRLDLLSHIVEMRFDEEAATYYWLRGNHHTHRGNFTYKDLEGVAAGRGKTKRTIVAHIGRLVSRGWVLKTAPGHYRFVGQDELARRHCIQPSVIRVLIPVSELKNKQVMFAARLKAEIHRAPKSTRLIPAHPLTGSDHAVLPRAGIAAVLKLSDRTVSRRVALAKRSGLLQVAETAKEAILCNYHPKSRRIDALRVAYPYGRLSWALSGATPKGRVKQAVFVVPGPNIYAAERMAVTRSRFHVPRGTCDGAYLGVPLFVRSRFGVKKRTRPAFAADHDFLSDTHRDLFERLDCSPAPTKKPVPYLTSKGPNLCVRLSNIHNSLYYSILYSSSTPGQNHQGS